MPAHPLSRARGILVGLAAGAVAGAQDPAVIKGRRVKLGEEVKEAETGVEEHPVRARAEVGGAGAPKQLALTLESDAAVWQ